MIDELTLLNGSSFKVNDYITIRHPRLKDVRDLGEENYWHIVTRLTSMPADIKVMLYDQHGLYYDKVDEFECFAMLVHDLRESDVSIFFGENFNFSKFEWRINTVNGDEVLYNPETHVVIDRIAYMQITDFIRKLHGMKKNCDVPYNNATRTMIIDSERRELERNKNKPFVPFMANKVSFLVNYEGFKYNYNTVWDLPIYTFEDALKRCLFIKEYNRLTNGSYDLSKLSDDSLNLLKPLS